MRNISDKESLNFTKWRYMQKIINGVHVFNLLAALFLTATTIFEFVDVPWGLLPHYLFFISYLVEFFLDRKWQTAKLDKTSIYFIGVLLFFLLAVMYYPFDSNTYFRVLLERRYALAGFAFVGFFGVNEKYKMSYFLNVFIATSLVVIFYLLFVRIGFLEFIQSDQKALLFNRTRTAYVNQHMGFNLFLDLSLVGIWYFLKTSWRKLAIWKRSLYFVVASFFLYFLLISEGRAGFLITIFLFCAIIAFELWHKYPKLGLFIALFMVVASIGFATQHQRIRNWNIESDPRLFLWESAWEVIYEKPIFGHGMSTAQEKFNVARQGHQTDSFGEAVNKIWSNVVIDSHNQVAQTWMEFGLIGVFLLLYLWIAPVFIVEKKQRLFLFLILLLCVNQSMFNPFVTGHSSTLFGILTLLVLRINNNLILKV